VDQEFRQLMLWLEAQARERSRAFDAWMEKSKRESEQRERESLRRHNEVMKHLEELRGESRAHIDALCRILDRLDDGGGGAAPA
jgi:hypothetical protein